MLEGPVVYVDIETNGLDHIRGRVIEVAAIRVENGRVIREFNQLIDPERELPQFTTSLTGITDKDLKGAPIFYQVARELHDILNGAVFVAHNVRFDYSFLKQEFKRVGLAFQPKQLCTVKLSKVLYPEERSHKLESLIRRHGFTFMNRHRAYDDAHVLWQFMQRVTEVFGLEVVEAAIARQIKQPALPKAIDPFLIKDLPETPGVYIFEDEQGKPLYIGKSINIKKRVLSHFGHDHDDSREFKIAQSIKHITTHQTHGELAALLLESQLVKEMQPLYNRQLRKLEKLLLAKQTINEAGYLEVYLEEAADIAPEEIGSILAVYPRRSRAKTAFEEVVKTFELCPKLLGLEKSKAGCFLYQLHKCRGACIGREPTELYNQRVLTAFERNKIQTWPYKSAILLEEQTGQNEYYALIVDKWCVIGEVTQEEACEPVIKTGTKHFDLDTYKILQSFLMYKLPKLSVKPLPSHVLAELVGC